MIFHLCSCLHKYYMLEMKPLLAFSNIPPFLSSNAMVLLTQSMADSDRYQLAVKLPLSVPVSHKNQHSQNFCSNNPKICGTPILGLCFPPELHWETWHAWIVGHYAPMHPAYNTRISCTAMAIILGRYAPPCLWSRISGVSSSHPMKVFQTPTLNQNLSEKTSFYFP